ncbi:MAG: YggT family protein [Chloroflexaceae bacterium]|jgi:YggT family protein
MVVQNFIALLFNILSMLILGRVLLSWIDPTGNMRISQVLRELTEPILGPIRSIMPNIGMIDISPIVAILLLSMISRLLLQAL